jgi:hypothetical protein
MGTTMEATGSCACDCDYDENRVWSQSIRTARKPHRCSECGCTIEPGERYLYAKFLSADGPPWSSYTSCVLCHRIQRDYAPCCELGGLRENIHDCLGFDYVTYDGTDDDDEEEKNDE